MHGHHAPIIDPRFFTFHSPTLRYSGLFFILLFSSTFIILILTAMTPRITWVLSFLMCLCIGLSAQPTANIFFEKADKTETVTTAQPFVEHPIILQNPTQNPLAIEVELIALDVLDEQGIGLLIAGGEKPASQLNFSLNPNEVRKITLKATLARPDTFEFWVVFRNPATTQQTKADSSQQALAKPKSRLSKTITRSIKIHRTQGEKSDAITVAGSSNILATSIAGLNHIPINLTLQDNKGLVDHQVRNWYISSLEREMDANVKSDVDYTHVDTRVNGTQSIQAGDEFLIPAGGGVQLKNIIKGLPAGKYTGKLSIETVPFQTLTHDFNITVRNPMGIAFLLILIGVVLSYLINRYQTQFRPRLVVQRQLGLIAEDITYRKGLPLLDYEHSILDGFFAELGLIDRLLSSKEIAQTEAQLALMGKKMGLFDEWVRTRQQVDQLPPANRDGFYLMLKKQGENWRVKVVNEAHIQEERNTLVQIDKQILDTHRTLWNSRLEEWEKSLDDQIAQAPHAQQKAALTQLKTEELGRVKKLVAGDFELAQGAFDTLRRSYVNVLREGLDRYLEEASPTGYQDAPDAWESVKTDVRVWLEASKNAPTVEKALAAYEEGYELYLTRVSQQLKTHVSRVETGGNSEAWEGVKTQLGHIDTALESHDLITAAKSYEAAREECSRLESAQPVPKTDAAEENAAKRGDLFDWERPTSSISSPIQNTKMAREELHLPGPITEPVQYELPDARVVSRQIMTYDLIIAGIALLLATFLGITLLYQGNYTWGSVGDYFTAILWGLGLHQATGAAFKGSGVGIGDALSQLLPTTPGSKPKPVKLDAGNAVES